MTRQIKSNNVDSADIVIVGNGITGLTAAVEARRIAPERRIVMITEQNHPTINTPALKQFAIGKLTREQLLAYPAGTERAQRIHVINARVEEIHALGNYVSLIGGRGFGYETLLIATGSTATGLPANLPGRDFDGVLTLHRLNDYLDMCRRLSEVEDAVVVGGGLHATETVVSLLYWGIRVHWLIRSDTFLPRMLDRPASDLALERIRRAGANVYTETEVIGIVGKVGSVIGVVTNQHQFLPCQLILVCTGTTPVTTLATHCDLPMKCKSGILVDDQLRTSVRNIYAAGDVAALKDPQLGEYAPRAQWYAAVLQGRIAATAMAGTSVREEGFGVPWHATRLGELSMLTVGNPLQWRDTATTLTDSSKGSYRRVSIVDDRLVGYLSLGHAQPDGLAIKRLIDEGHSIRHIKKALLKGKFDARKYFSHQRTYAAQYMVNTGKVPSPVAIESPLQTQSLVRTLRETGPLAAPGETVTYNGVKSEVNTHPLRDTYVHHTPIQRISDAIFDESEALFLEGGFTPDQAMHQLQDKPYVIESTLVALPSNTSRRTTSSLWSYSAKLPAVNLKRKPGQFIASASIHMDEQTITDSKEKQYVASSVLDAKQPKHLSTRIYPSSSLWCYTDEHVAVKKGH
jgi:NADPH-dependent 2,4-dienoyl-CoA reductase/sulfur reductase-like enzyme